ncbi:hypothetical protein D6789_00125, partial [Candidatus Woesearchaeota archaeon]
YDTPRYQSLFRKSWAPYRAIVEGAGQRTLVSYANEARHRAVITAFEALRAHGYSFVAPKTPYEVLRMKGPGATVIKYTTGKLLVQGRAKLETERLLKKHGLA